PSTTETYTLSLHDALPICARGGGRGRGRLESRGGRLGARNAALGDLGPHRVASKVLFGDVGEIGAAEIGDGQLAEDVVDDRGGHLDAVVALDHAVGLEAGEDEGVHELLERHAVLESQRDGDGEA